MSSQHYTKCKCNKCNTVGITDSARHFAKCHFCDGYQHVECFEGNVTHDKLVKSANIIYKCAECIIKHPNLSTALLNIEEIKIKSLVNEYAETLHELNNNNEIMKNKCNNQDILLQDSTRKNKVQKDQFMETEKQLLKDNLIKDAELKALQQKIASLNTQLSSYEQQGGKLTEALQTIETLNENVRTLEHENAQHMYARSTESPMHALEKEPSNRRNRTDENEPMTGGIDQNQLLTAINHINAYQVKILEITQKAATETHEIKNLSIKVDNNLIKVIQEGNMSQNQNIQNSMPSTSSNVNPYGPQVNMPSTSSNVNQYAPQAMALNMNALNPSPNSTQIQQVPQVNMTFAQALKYSSIQPEAIRNISLMGTPEHVKHTIDKIKADQIILDMRLIAIIRKSDNNYTVKCPDKDTAELFHDHITRSYSTNSVICSTVVERRPQVKISGAGISIDENEDASAMKEGILVQILHQNKWMAR